MSQIDALLGQMMALHPAEIDLNLSRIERLLAALGAPERRLPGVIHLAGTNGKGSTLAMLRAGCAAAGLRVHAYTSPHLERFNERIVLAGQQITDAALADILARVLQANGDHPITFFEATTAAALLAMSETEADVTLLETGLGGRLDATNVVTPRLCILTPIDLDHQDYLGDTLAEIAAEKAGILKPGIPCVVGRQPDEALDVIEARAARIGAPLHIAGQHWQIAPDRDRLAFTDETGLLDLPRPALRGAHQIENAGMAVAALRLLGHGADSCEAALATAQWPARMQAIRTGALADIAPGCEIWLDGGHNPAAGRALAALLSELPPRNTRLICGMLNTKDVEGFLRPLAPLVRDLTAVSIPGQAQTLPADTTADAARRSGIAASCAEGLLPALREIAADSPEVRIVICGSLYLAGHVLAENARGEADG